MVLAHEGMPLKDLLSIYLSSSLSTSLSLFTTR